MKSKESMRKLIICVFAQLFFVSLGFEMVDLKAQAFQAPFVGNKLKIDLGSDGVWEGYASGDQFVFHNLSNGTEAIVSKKPTTQEVFELSGVLASDVASTTSVTADVLLQRHLSAAINRHTINTSVLNGTVQNLGDVKMFYTQGPNNEFAAFFHSKLISYNGDSFAFMADNTLNPSGSISVTNPSGVKISIGGFADYSTTSLVSDTTSSTISVYPNPTHNLINIVGAGDFVDYAIFNISGEKLLESNGNTIDMSDLSPNLYFLRINERMFKIVKE